MYIIASLRLQLLLWRCRAAISPANRYQVLPLLFYFSSERGKSLGTRLAYSCVGTIYFRPRSSFSADFCPMFIAFLQPEMQLAINRSLPTPPHQHKVLGTNESVRGFCKFLDMFNQETSPTVQNFMWGAYFCMVAYKHDVVVVIKNGCLYSWGAYFQ